MADAKEKEINEGNENNTQQQLIESLQNELRLASEQYQKVCIDLNIQIETNNEMMDELKTLRTKYDAMSCQKSSTFEEIISNQQNVNQLQELQLKYEESERENTQILQAMEMLIIESNKKNDGMRKEMEHQLNEAQLAHEEQMDELIQEKEDMTQQIKQLKEQNDALNANDALQRKYNELQSKQTKCDQMKPNIKELWELRGREKEYKQRISDMNSKHDALKKDHAAVQSELNEMQKTQKESIAKYKTKAKNAVHKHKGNAKKQINTMQQQMDDISHKYEQMIDNIDSLTKQNEKLLLQNDELMAQNTILRDKYDALNKQSNDAMKECQSKTETSHIIEILQMECDQMKKQNQGLNRRMDELHQEYVDRNSNKSHELQTQYEALQTQYEALQSKHNASMSKYKEKAKNVVNKHKSNAKKEMSAMKQELNEMRTKYEECMNNIVLLTNKNQELVLKNEQLQSWQNNMSSNMMSLTHKMNSNQDDVNKLSGRCVALKQTNGKLESKIRAMMHDEEQFKRKLNDALSASL
eukprot:404399_1